MVKIRLHGSYIASKGLLKAVFFSELDDVGVIKLFAVKKDCIHSAIYKHTIVLVHLKLRK